MLYKYEFIVYLYDAQCVIRQTLFAALYNFRSKSKNTLLKQIVINLPTPSITAKNVQKIFAFGNGGNLLTNKVPFDYTTNRVLHLLFGFKVSSAIELSTILYECIDVLI